VVYFCSGAHTRHLPQRNDDIPVCKIALEYVGEKIFSGDCLIDIDLLPLAGSGLLRTTSA
jgi:hypothetical protein